MKNFAVIGCVVLILFVAVGSRLVVSAQTSTEYFTFVTSKEEVYEKDEVRISILANDVPMDENIAGFRLSVQFDSSKLTFRRADTSSQIQNGTFRYHVNGDTMTGIYVCDGTSAPKLSGECITLVFRVGENAILGETSVSAQIDQMVDWSAEQLASVSSITSIFTLRPEFTREAILTKLVPDHGELEPTFDPYIQEYTLDVEPEVDQVLFELEAADEGTARVNRKNLGKRGSVTQFLVIVTSADGKNKSQYVINVNRGEVTGIANTSSGKSNSLRTTSSSSGKSGGTAGIDDGINEGTAMGTAAETVFYGDRNLYIIGNQMPTYMMYMILGGAGILVLGMAAAIFVIVRKKRK